MGEGRGESPGREVTRPGEQSKASKERVPRREGTDSERGSIRMEWWRFKIGSSLAASARRLLESEIHGPGPQIAQNVCIQKQRGRER